MNFKNVPREERNKIAMDFMGRGICPICEVPMQKNGKRTHSKTKAMVCEELLREALKVQRSTMQMPDGKNLEVDVRTMSKKDAHNLKGFRHGAVTQD